MRSVKFNVRKGLFARLSTHTYRSVAEAMAELIINGMDSAHLAGRLPKIIITVFEKGQHPLSPNGKALSVIDNGLGFTDNVIERYCDVGESAWEGSSGVVQGQFGIGKIAAMSLGAGEVSPYYIVTRTSKSGRPEMVFITADTIERESGWKSLPNKSGFDYLPSSESFAEILIPDYQDNISLDELRRQLTYCLPTFPWKVTVNGQEVSHRQFDVQTSFTSPVLPELGGVIEIELGIPKVSDSRDCVMLEDSERKRLVCSLGDVARLGEIHGAILNPRLVGTIKAPGLSAFSTTDRAGLRAAFWRSHKGKVVKDAILLWANQLAEDLVGKSEASGKDVMGFVNETLDLFRQAFGSPKQVLVETPSNKDDAKTKNGGSGSRVKRETPEGINKGGSPQHQNNVPRVRIKDQDYFIYSYPLSSDLPAQARDMSGAKAIIINTQHLSVKRLMQERLAVGTKREHVVRWLVEAHVLLQMNRSSAETLVAWVYRILDEVLYNKKS